MTEVSRFFLLVCCVFEAIISAIDFFNPEGLWTPARFSGAESAGVGALTVAALCAALLAAGPRRLSNKPVWIALWTYQVTMVAVQAVEVSQGYMRFPLAAHVVLAVWVTVIMFKAKKAADSLQENLS